MVTTPLRTKLQRPKLGPTGIQRPHLLRRLDEGLAGKVTLISAPAGFGKSTLVSSWLGHLDALPAATPAPLFHRTGWLSIGEEDDEFPRFLLYLVSAIEASFPHCCAGVIELVQGSPSPAIEMLTDVLVQHLAELADPLVLVLDDLHLVTNEAIYSFLGRLVQYAPPQIHLVLVSRVDPPLPLNYWRAQGYLNELRLHDLSFTLAETTAFLSRNLDHKPDPALIEVLHRRTEGWAVGLRLALIALRSTADYAEFASHFDATNTRYIADYLIDEVLDHQSPPLKEFLICTAILNRFCAGLCAAVLEIDEAAAQQHVGHLERENLFLIALSPSPLWYRYHHQFQGMLLSRLHMRYGPETIATLHRRAAAWLSARDQVGEALRHLTQIPDYAAAAGLIEDQRTRALNQLRFLELEGWLNPIPPHVLNQRPELLISLAWVRFSQVDNERCLAAVQRAEMLLHEQAAGLLEMTRRLLEAELVALRTSLDRSLDPAEALALIRQSWRQIRPHVATAHCYVVLWLAYTSQRLGDLHLALEIVLTTLEDATEWPMIGRCRVLHTAGFFHYCDGDLAQAEQRFRQNLRLAEQHGLVIISTISQHGLGAIADARNQLDLAEQYHLEVIKHPHQTGGLDAVVDMYSLVRIYARRGQPERSRKLVNRLKEDARTMGQSFFIEQVAALEAFAELTCGDLAKAMRWALAQSRRQMRNVADRVPVIRARILLASGSQASLLEADELLQGLIERHEADFAWYRLAEALVLQALARAELGQADAALKVLGRAVQIAVPKGDVEPFYEHGQATQRLLRELEKWPEHTRLVQLLLAGYPDNEMRAGPRATGGEMPEPLTERELDVLALLAERLSNKEIARAMVVSPHTVRNHLANIFGKLQVQNRIQAIERARELGLLPTSPQRQTPIRI